jgi:hypothetical protein
MFGLDNVITFNMVGVEISDGSVIRGDSHRDTENGDNGHAMTSLDSTIYCKKIWRFCPTTLHRLVMGKASATVESDEQSIVSY